MDHHADEFRTGGGRLSKWDKPDLSSFTKRGGAKRVLKGDSAGRRASGHLSEVEI
jgi:hypothetical protein